MAHPRSSALRLLSFTVAALSLFVTPLAGQTFKAPAGLAHIVFRPLEDEAAIEGLRAWTFGVGVSVGSEGASRNGMVAHLTYGGPYWYLAGSIGLAGTGSAEEGDPAFGLAAHYNVLQTRDRRTRVGWQAGWSWAATQAHGPHTFDYRAVVSHSMSPTFAVFSAVGGETRWSSRGAPGRASTAPTLLGGLSAHFGDRVSVSPGIESLLRDEGRWRFAGSVQLRPIFQDLPVVRSEAASKVDPRR